MKKYITFTLLALFALVLGSLGLVSAAADFTINPTTYSATVNVGTHNTQTFTITNTGNTSLDLAIADTDLIYSGTGIATNLDKASVTNLTPGAQTTVAMDYTMGQKRTVGTDAYTGTLTVTGSGVTKNVAYSVVVNNPGIGRLSVTSGLLNGSIILSASAGTTGRKTLHIKNIGNVTITGLTLYAKSNLLGTNSDNRIKTSDVDRDFDQTTLDAGESTDVQVQVYVDSAIQNDVYTGQIVIDNDQNFQVSMPIEVTTDGSSADVEFQSGLYLKDTLLTVSGEAGSNIDSNTYFTVKNVGDVDVQNLQFQFDGDLQEEYSTAVIPASAITFSKTNLDLNTKDSEEVKLSLKIPADTKSGNYYAKLRVLSSTGTQYDSIRVKLVVQGDVYFDSITFPSSALLGSNLDVNVAVKNQGASVYRNVKITGIVMGTDNSDSDISQSSPTFLLDVGQIKTQTLRFAIPEDATNGPHTIEIHVKYGDNELVETKQFEVSRPVHNLKIISNGINPSVVTCEDQTYTFIKLQNLGQFSETIKMNSQITGTSVSQQTSSMNVDVDQTLEKNFVLDTKTLAPGKYTVLTTISYNFGQTIQKSSDLIVQPCTNATVNVIVKNTNTTVVPENSTGVNLFGTHVSTGTVWLGGGVALLTILIVISLFFL